MKKPKTPPPDAIPKLPLARFEPAGELVEPVEVPKVEPEIKDEIVTDDMAIAIFEQSGLVALNTKVIRDMATLGVYAKQIGTVKTQRGKTLMSQQALVQQRNAITRIATKLAKNLEHPSARITKGKVEMLTGLTKALVELTKVELESTALMLEMGGDPTTRQPDEERPKRNTFAPGEQLRPITRTNILTQSVTINQPADAPK